MRVVNKIFTIIIFALAFWVKGQEDQFANKSRFMQKSNPSFFGYNNLNKIGFLYNTVSVSDSDNSDNKYLFGALSMENQNFSLGFEVNSFKLQSSAFTINKGRAAFVYRLQLSNNLYFLPSFSLGFTSSSISASNLVFEDQINIFTGAISNESTDPLSLNLASLNYIDIGASFIVHNDTFIAGLSLKQLNGPNASLNKDETNKLPILISLQGGYEFDINQYQNGFLPESSFLYLYTNVTSFSSALQVTLSQDVQLGTFAIGLTQELSKAQSFGLTSVGLSAATSFENFDLGFQYNFPMRQVGKIHAPSLFELYLVFNFSIYRRNTRGRFKRISIDNY